MSSFLLLAWIQRRMQRALWRKELSDRFPTREAYAEHVEKETNVAGHAVINALRQGYQDGHKDGYAQGYQAGRDEEMARAREVFKEAHDRDMCEERVRRFVQ